MRRMNNTKNLSQGNAFTVGYGAQPHGFDPTAPVKKTALPPKHVKAGFGARNGTIPGGLGRGSGLSLKKYRD